MSVCNVSDGKRPTGGIGSRVLTLLYGVSTYLFFFATFVYLVGFVGDWVVPKTIDSGQPAPSAGDAIAINLLLLGLFAVQHTIMARPAFKQWWTRIVPPQVERSTFVLLATVALAVMVWQWRPIPDVIWQVTSPAGVALLSGISLAGWTIVFISTYLIDHFALFGLRQTVSYALARPESHAPFTERWFYRYVRHPLMSGFLIAFWFTPTMTQGHLLFAVANTVYILFGVTIEERTLIYLHGGDYEAYRKRVPMLFPFRRPTDRR